MIDLMHVDAYRENNRIEAKKALGGLPHSIWETYSAFANALGGVILLGVEEHKDTSLAPVDLPDPEGMVRLFWERMRDGKTVSVNILNEEHVRIAEVDGKHIIAIEVPRARRSLRPVYIGGDPMTGTYRRSGEGDYRCKREEVLEMQRDAARQTADMRLLTDLTMDALDSGSVAEYLSRIGECGDREAALVRLGTADEAEGALHPTAAGLLLLGRTEVLCDRYPHCSLVYRGRNLISSCNVFDFYNRVMTEFCCEFEPELIPALREALANCLLNADYHSGGVEICRTATEITLINAGPFRIDASAAVRGGVSDPRNLALSRLFAYMGVGHGSGSGLKSIMKIWQKRGWAEPTIRETFAPARVTVRLPLVSADTASEPEGRLPYPLQKGAVLAYVTEHIRVTGSQIAEMMDGDAKAAERCLAELMEEGILSEEQPGVYRLKR